MFNNFYQKRMMPFYEADGSASGADDSNAGKDGGERPSFAELMKNNSDYQSELDRRINQAVETATAKATEKERKRQEAIRNEEMEEVTRVANMTPEEKDKYYANKEKEKAKAKDAELTMRELKIDARTALQEKGLPDAFVDLLNYTDADACEKSIGTLESAFRKAVQEAVNDKLKGNQPPKDAGTEGKKPEADKTEKEKELANMRKFAGVRK